MNGSEVELLRTDPNSLRLECQAFQIDCYLAMVPRSIKVKDGSILLVNMASVRALANEAGMLIDASRFRPNFVVDSGVPFDEDTWASVTIGLVEFNVIDRCDRCFIICFDQDTGEQAMAPYDALRRLRGNDRLTFGVFLDVADLSVAEQFIWINDPISVQYK